MKLFFTVLGILFFIGTAAMAQEEAAPAPAATPTEEWKSNVGASALVNTGNSSSQTFGGNGLLSHRKDRNKVEATANGAYGRAKDASTGDSTTNTKNWKAQLRYDRFLTDPISVFGLGHVGSDEPAGFDFRYGGALGMAHEIWKTDPNFFKYEVGFDYTRENRITPPDGDIYSGRSFLKYEHKFSKVAMFGQDVESLFNVKEGKDVRLNTLTALTVKLTDMLAFQAGYAVRFDNVPVTGKKKTDTSTQLGLVVTLM